MSGVVALPGRAPIKGLVRTGNADANAPMLAINTRLGFKPAWAQSIWEIGIADARRYVEAPDRRRT